MKEELLTTYATELQKIYDDRTAGDHTFIGLLSEFQRKFTDEFVYVLYDMHADSWNGTTNMVSVHSTVASAIAAIPENIRKPALMRPLYDDWVANFTYFAVKRVRLER